MSILGTPGIQTTRSASPRRVLLSDQGRIVLPRGRVVDGSKARDPLNTGDLDVLRAGMLMGKITASSKWAPSVIGKVASDYTSGGTTLTVSAATAVELNRRVGASGTFKLTHAPTATGTVVEYTTVTYSAVNTSTGAITVTDIGANVDEGALVMPIDGSQVPLAILEDGFGLKVTDRDGTSIDVQAENLLIGGIIDTESVVNWPAAEDTTLITWLKQELNSTGKFFFSDDF